MPLRPMGQEIGQQGHSYLGLVYRQKLVNSDKAGGAQLILMVSRKPRRVMMSKSHWDNVIGGV